MQGSNYFDQIDQYLNGELTVQEKNAFEKELDQNPEIQKAMDQYLLSMDAIDVLVEDNLRAELQQLKKSEKLETEGNVRRLGQRTGGRRRLLTSLAAAASVALLVGFFTLNWATSTYSTDNLQLAYYDAPGGVGVRGGGQSASELLDDGFAALKANKFEDAKAIFAQIANGDSTTTAEQKLEARYLLGHVAYAQADYQEARSQFEFVRTQGVDRFTEKAEWYSILAGLASGTKDETFNQLLDQLKTDSGHSFHNEARELDSKMSSFWYDLVN